TLALAEARTGQMQQRLRLAALADRLDEPLMAQFSAALAPVPTAATPAPPAAAAPAATTPRAPRQDRK
ncbi:MAG TPA: hypothetical protein PLH50_12245, partial [Ottowia beijingensis]|nr:hypothetical protein [Ottowia beijingensis]